jgi:hypothetical protein
MDLNADMKTRTEKKVAETGRRLGLVHHQLS